jgi:hypothetical protein
MSWEELAECIASQSCNQALCIVNLKKHALALYSELEKRQAIGLFHLSTNMCPAHRKVVLDKVRDKLKKKGEACRLISTQCVEAGVDVDFPVVFRAWGPLDAMAQAAGRCNRNGCADSGVVHVFMPEEENYPDGAYRQAADIARILLKKHGAEGMDIQVPELFAEYYKELYDFVRPPGKKKDLINAIKRQDFAEAARLYRVIDRNSINVLVLYDPEAFYELAAEVRKTGLTKRWIAKARPHTVGLFRPKHDDHIRNHIEPVPIGRNVSSEEWFIYLRKEHYSPETGLVPPTLMDCLIA